MSTLSRFFSLMLCLPLIAILVSCELEKGAKVLHVYNWSEYMDMDLVKEFEKEYGVKVQYDTYTSNEELMAKLQAGSSGYDVVFPSDYTVKALIGQQLLMPLGDSALPNLKNIAQKWRKLPFDPEGKFSVPYFWGTVGIAYNSKKVKGNVDSWTVLLNSAYKNRITILDSHRDAIGMALKTMGFSMNSVNPREIDRAEKLLIEQKPLVRAYTSDTHKMLLISGEIWLAQSWAGDAMNAKEENPDIEFVVPKEGTNLWMDNICVPATADNPELAIKFIDFLLRPEISARLSNFVKYASPNEASLPLTNKELLENPALYPPQEVLNKSEWFIDLGEGNALWDLAWARVKG